MRLQFCHLHPGRDGVPDKDGGLKVQVLFQVDGVFPDRTVPRTAEIRLAASMPWTTLFLKGDFAAASLSMCRGLKSPHISAKL